MFEIDDVMTVGVSVTNVGVSVMATGASVMTVGESASVRGSVEVAGRFDHDSELPLEASTFDSSELPDGAADHGNLLTSTVVPEASPRHCSRSATTSVIVW